MFDKINLIKQNGYTPTHVFDIGAYHGHWTLSAVSIFPDAKYVMIEANNHPELNSFKGYTNVHVLHEILNDKKTDVVWHKMGTTGDSLFKEQTGLSNQFAAISRTSITLNDCISKYALDLSTMTNIFIKIDCQGAEIAILKGAADVLAKTDFILLEIPLFGQYNAGVSSFLEHIQYMDLIGFQPYDIVENHYINNYNMQVDMLFINKRHSFAKDVQDKLAISINK